MPQNPMAREPVNLVYCSIAISRRSSPSYAVSSMIQDWRAPTDEGTGALAARTLVALRAASGQRLWRYILPGGRISEPLVG